MNSFLRNTISKLYNAVSAPVAATRDAASLLYNRIMENIVYGQERLKDMVEKETEEENPAAAKEEEKNPQGPTAPKEQQQDDDERYDTVAKIKLCTKKNT